MQSGTTSKCLLLVASITFFMAACDSGGDNDPPEEQVFDRAGMLENIGLNYILPAYDLFLAQVQALEQEVDAFAADPSVVTLGNAQSALVNARIAWQRVSFLQFGPAESVALRGVLNTFPTNTEQIAANINSGNYTLGSVENIAAGGFPAMGYLLHGEGLSAEEVVALFTSDVNAANRLKYLEDNNDFVMSNTAFVVNQWSAQGGNYINTFLSDAKGGIDVGSSLGELVNAMVLHFERFMRDGKIGIPAGVRSAGVPRPRATEAFYGGYSRMLALVNLSAMRLLFKGSHVSGEEGLGLEENLTFLEAAGLALDINETFIASETVVSQLSDPLTAQIDADPDKMVAAFTQMQELVVLLKVDMTSRLGITITFQDNDGD